LPTARYNPVAALGPDGRIYVLGGYNFTYLTTVEVYDSAADSWSAGPAMHQGREGGGATMAQGVIFVVGGRDGSTIVSTLESLALGRH
jgi:hypothetical protein